MIFSTWIVFKPNARCWKMHKMNKKILISIEHYPYRNEPWRLIVGTLGMPDEWNLSNSSVISHSKSTKVEFSMHSCSLFQCKNHHVIPVTNGWPHFHFVNEMKMIKCMWYRNEHSLHNNFDSGKVKTRQIDWNYEMNSITWTEMNCFGLIVLPCKTFYVVMWIFQLPRWFI